MRKTSYIMFALASAMLWTGCSQKKTDVANDSIVVDDTVMEDSVPVDTLEELIEETPMPKAADELFDDFMFNFAANKKLQTSRVKFPLTEDGGEGKTYKNKSSWKMDHFFMDQDYYTIIFDNRRQMQMGKDTSVCHAVIEKIMLDKDNIKQYVFDRVNGRWMLTNIKHSKISDSDNASFLQFYNHFATDSSFQASHLANEVEFTGPDPDDDFSTMTGYISADTWPAFAPELPAGMIYNIIYGDPQKGSNQKIFVMRGIANGMEMEFTFKKEGGLWKLSKMVQ